MIVESLLKIIIPNFKSDFKTAPEFDVHILNICSLKDLPTPRYKSTSRHWYYKKNDYCFSQQRPT